MDFINFFFIFYFCKICFMSFLTFRHQNKSFLLLYIFVSWTHWQNLALEKKNSVIMLKNVVKYKKHYFYLLNFNHQFALGNNEIEWFACEVWYWELKKFPFNKWKYILAHSDQMWNHIVNETRWLSTHLKIYPK